MKELNKINLLAHYPFSHTWHIYAKFSILCLLCLYWKGNKDLWGLNDLHLKVETEPSNPGLLAPRELCPVWFRSFLSPPSSPTKYPRYTLAFVLNKAKHQQTPTSDNNKNWQVTTLNSFQEFVSCEWPISMFTEGNLWISRSDKRMQGESLQVRMDYWTGAKAHLGVSINTWRNSRSP